LLRYTVNGISYKNFPWIKNIVAALSLKCTTIACYFSFDIDLEFYLT